MRNRNGQTAIEARSRTCSTMPMGAESTTWSMTATAELQSACDFEAALRAIAAHDQRQPLQVTQSAHKRLGISLRTTSGLRLLEQGQGVIYSLSEKLGQLIGALLLHGQAKAMKLSPVRVEPNVLEPKLCYDRVRHAQRHLSRYQVR